MLSTPSLSLRISLNTLTLNVKSEKVYTRHGVPISVTGIAQVRLSEPFPQSPLPNPATSVSPDVKNLPWPSLPLPVEKFLCESPLLQGSPRHLTLPASTLASGGLPHTHPNSVLATGEDPGPEQGDAGCRLPDVPGEDGGRDRPHCAGDTGGSPEGYHGPHDRGGGPEGRERWGRDARVQGV